jgi:hypothetical protein
MRQTLFGGLLVAALVVAMGVTPDSVVAQGKEKDKVTKEKEKAKDKATKGAVIEIGKGKDDKFRFFVRDHDGHLLAMSSPGGFASVKDAEVAIDKLKEAVAKAKVVMKDDKDNK